MQTADDSLFKRIFLEILHLSLFGGGVAFILFDWISAMLLLTGGAVSALGFQWMKKTVSSFLSGGKSKALKKILLLYGARLVLIIGTFFIIILTFAEKTAAFLVGFSMIIPALFIETTAALIRRKKWKN